MAKTCIECGSPMIREARQDEVSYKGESLAFEVIADWCQNPECGEAILDGPALKATAKARAELKARVEGVLSPSEVAQIRESLHLSQRAAGELLGGGPMAFHKYESGKQSVSVAMSNLLRILQHSPKSLELLRHRASH